MTIDLRHAAIAIVHCIVAGVYAHEGHLTEAICSLIVGMAYAAACVARRVSNWDDG